VSVPGRTGSHHFAFDAAVDMRGSAQITVQPAAIAVANSCTWLLCMFSPRWLPISTRQRALAMSVRSGEPGSSPKVRRKPTSRGPRHWAKLGAARFGVP